MEHLRHRLSDLLLLLLGTLETQQEGQALQPAEILKLVSGAGYQAQDLQDLWDWLQDRRDAAERPQWLSSQQVGRASRRALRQMGPREDEAVTVPAFGYLLELVRTGQITAEQMESLIQFAQLVPDGPLSSRELCLLWERIMVGERATGASGPGRWNNPIH